MKLTSSINQWFDQIDDLIAIIALMCIGSFYSCEQWLNCDFYSCE